MSARQRGGSSSQASNQTQSAIPTRPSSSLQTLSLPSASASASHSSATNFNSFTINRTRPETINVEKRSFWKGKGMDAFVDWMTDPENHQRLNNPLPLPGRRACDVHQEIANYVNSLHSDLKWTVDNVKSKIQYAKKKYVEARAIINSTDGDIEDATFCEQALTLMPDYNRFQAVYGASLDRNRPRPKKSVVYLDDLPEDNSDIEVNIADEIPEPTAEDRQLTMDGVESSVSELNRKRRRRYELSVPQHVNDSMAGFTTAEVTEPSTRAKAAESSLADIAETRRDLRRRELIMEEKEKKSYQRMVDVERKYQEMLDRRQQELMEEKAELKAQMEAFHAQKEAFHAQKEAFHAQKEAFQAHMEAQKLAFQLTREKLVSENAVMKRELELR
ncbi:hypothetical protein BGX27_001755 [Mortierella sp. AM989]|nr:hypothetical protein BGX27_001755 [Mortierella sp. AM989]